MAGQDRLTALLNQSDGNATVTGIDFIQVDNPAIQTLLRVFFLINPDRLVDPIVQTEDLPLEIPPDAVTIISVSGGERLATVSVVQAIYRQVVLETGIYRPALPDDEKENQRTVLEIQTAEAGDFSIYRLTINAVEYVESSDPPRLRLILPERPEYRLDRFFNGVEFSFKQGCPSPLDCNPPETECPPETLVDFPIDYLARDFISLRNALLDFATQRYPDWTEKIEADAGVMLMEVMAALGDELSYIQDRYHREAYLETLTQRRSLDHHAQLIDYSIDEGLSASTFLNLTVREGLGGIYAIAGSLVWSPSQGEDPIPFELGEGLLAQSEANSQGISAISSRFWVNSAWNTIPVHVPDAANPCLGIGATELFLRGTFPTSEQVPEEADSADFWLGKWVLLETQPNDPSISVRRHLVRLMAVEQTTDPLCLDEQEQPLAITRIQWENEQALPFELCLSELVVRGNLVFATAGETFEEYFQIRSLDEDSLNSSLINLAIERQGLLDGIQGQRNPLFRYSLQKAENRGLGWLNREGKIQPEIQLQEVDIDELNDNQSNLADLPVTNFWHWQPTLLDSTAFQENFTLDNGTWRQIISFRRIGETITHADYANNAGFTIRFGDGEFGKIPARETVFRVLYRTGSGTKANLPSDTITEIINPANETISFTLANSINDDVFDLNRNNPEITAVNNPFAIINGAAPEAAEVVKQLAPEAFRALTFRAVRPEDYAEIAERLPWVQRAGARNRYTGSWLSTFVTADPLNAFELSQERRRELTNLMDCVRQVGREVFVKNPRYVNLDLEIHFCVKPSAYVGQVQARVMEALLGRGGIRPIKGFFDPDNFTFGTPLKRSALEATIQAVSGVLGVENMRIRGRGITDWRIFDELTFNVGSDQIIRLRNDPRFPNQGSLRLLPR